MLYYRQHPQTPNPNSNSSASASPSFSSNRKHSLTHSPKWVEAEPKL